MASMRTKCSESADKTMVFLRLVVVTKKYTKASCGDKPVHRAQTVGYDDECQLMLSYRYNAILETRVQITSWSRLV